MLTPDDLRSMTPEDRTQLFMDMAARFYGTKSNAVKLSEDFDISKPTVFAWRRKHTTPWAVIFTLDAWLNSDAASERLLDDWHSLPADLGDATRALGRVAATLTTIARRLPAARDAEKSSVPEA